MLLIACALSLLAIAAGMMLLAQTKKENLGNLFKYVSWFIVIMGFLCIVCIGCRSAMRCCMRAQNCRNMKVMMMRDDDGNGCYMERGMREHGGMGCERGMMGGCGMMMGGGCYRMGSCCGGEREECENGMGSCHENMGECKDGMGGCTDGDSKCTEGMSDAKGGSCPMHGGMMMNKKDSAKSK